MKRVVFLLVVLGSLGYVIADAGVSNVKASHARTAMALEGV